jgi:hypothetical protein
VIFEPFGDPATATSLVTMVYPPSSRRVDCVVVLEIVATPEGPATVVDITLPRASYAVHDHAVSPLVFVPTVRPHASYAYSVVIGLPVAGVGPVVDLRSPNCLVPAGRPHTAGALLISP